MKADPRQSEPLGVVNCVNAATGAGPQALNWTFTPVNKSFPQLIVASDGTNFSDLPDRVSGPVSLENLNVGALMTVTGGATANNSTLGQFQRNDSAGVPPVPQQGWNIDWLPPADPGGQAG